MKTRGQSESWDLRFSLYGDVKTLCYSMGSFSSKKTTKSKTKKETYEYTKSNTENLAPLGA